MDQIAEALIPFGAPLTQEKLSAIQAYVELLLRWNRMIGLTAVDDPIEIVTRHFGESLFAGTFLPLQHGRLADVGTGAGFPGLALKIAYPDLSVVLLEPNLKKCAFLHEVSGALDLRSVDVVRSRFEDYGDKSLFDFVCSRALGKYSGLMRWARDLLPCTGRIVLWLGDEDSLLVSRTEGWIWDPPVRIPESRRRVILSGHPVDRSLTKIVPRETKF